MVRRSLSPCYGGGRDRGAECCRRECGEGSEDVPTGADATIVRFVDRRRSMNRMAEHGASVSFSP
jgi:hypothetical protein